MRKLLPLGLVFALSLAVPAFAGQAKAPKSTQSKTPAAGPVNLNTASQAELESLPGVGKATAKKIIAGRPYTAVADLAKAGVPKNTIEKITPMVTVGGAAPAPAPAAAPAPAPASKPAPAPAAPSAASAPAASAPRTSSAPATAQQPPVKGMVWVNLETKVFHREGDRYYGNTKHGKFMTEEDAVKAGYREAKMRAKKQ